MNLSELMGGTRHRRRRRRSRKLRGGKCPFDTAASVGGARSRRRRSRNRRSNKRSCKKGGNRLVPLGLLGALLAVGPKKHRGSKRHRRRGSKRRRR